MSIVKYVPSRDWAGKFVPSKKKVFKFLFVIVALASFYSNYALAKQIWNLKCAEGGYFTTKVECGELAQAKFDAKEFYRLELKDAMAQEREIYE